MIVICEECGRKYRIDPSKIKGKAASFKCRACSHVIVVSKPAPPKNVCRIPLSRMRAGGKSRTGFSRPSQAILSMLEELMVIFENTVSARKKMKSDFTKLLKKKFVENAEKYAFLDPFAGEFDYSNRKIDFSGAASDKELIDGVVNCIQELALELGMLPQLLNACAEWSDKYARQLENFSIKL